MMYVIGQLSTGEFVMRTGEYISGTLPSSDSLLAKAFTDSGIGVADLRLYTVTDPAVIERINKDHEYVLTWTDLEITGIDFSLEDSKRMVVFKATDPTDPDIMKLEIVGDGVDYSRILVQVYLPDMSGIDTNYNESVKIPFVDPDNRKASLYVNIVNGLAYRDFRSTKYGVWSIISGHNFEGLNAKVYPAVYDIEVLLNLID